MNTVIARRDKDGHIVTLNVAAVEHVNRGNFGGSLPCTATGVSGERYTIDPNQFEVLKKAGFMP